MSLLNIHVEWPMIFWESVAPDGTLGLNDAEIKRGRSLDSLAIDSSCGVERRSCSVVNNDAACVLRLRSTG